MQNSEPQCFILVRGPFHVKKRACLLNASLRSELCRECLFVRTTERLFSLYVERFHLCWKYIWKTLSGACSSAMLTASLFYEICVRQQPPPPFTQQIHCTESHWEHTAGCWACRNASKGASICGAFYNPSWERWNWTIFSRRKGHSLVM